MATSQIPLISVPFKRTDDIDWISPLRRYIAQHYQDDPEKYTQETYSLNRLRQDIRGAGKDITGRDLLYRYFGQLELLDLRFPVDEKHVKILFTWYDAFSGRTTSQYSLAYEKASVIFNIAATLSAIASMQNRAEPDGRKRAFHFLQASAGMFEYINENFLHAPSQDLSRETVHLLAELMLAQAQECFLENSIREKKKDGLIAKLASHVVWVYGNLVDDIQEATNARSVTIDKAWLLMCQIKQKYYQGLAQQYKASACEAQGNYGEQVARLGVAEQVGKEAAGKLATSLVQQVASSSTTTSASGSPTSHANGTLPADSGIVLQELCKALAATCGEKYTAATRDNDMIYHEHVPQESILTPIDRLKAVQPIPMAELYGSGQTGSEQMSKVIGADIFAKLIPLSVHESASLYSEEQAKLVRAETDKCDVAKAELKASMEYMKLPQSLDKFKHSGNPYQIDKQMEDLMLPPSNILALADDVAKEENTGQGVRQNMEQLETLKTKARNSLDQVGLSLDQETRDCESMRVKYGDLWLQAPSGSLTSHFRQDLRNHRQSLESGTQSDSNLYRQYDLIKKDLDILRQGNQNRALERIFVEQLTSALDRDNSNNKKDVGENSLLDLDIESSDTTTETNTSIKVQQVENIIDKLFKLEKDRNETLQDLKERMQQDDISQLLILNRKTNAEQHLFMSELEKYRPHQQRITATIHQQQQLIQELGTAFKSLMEGEEAKKLQAQWDKVERQKRLLMDQLVRARDSYLDVKNGLGKGIEFYTNLNEAIDALGRNTQTFIEDRGRERQRMADDLETTQSNREQEILKERLNMYTASAPEISQLVDRTKQMTMNGQSSTSPSYSYPKTTQPPPPPPVPQQYSQSSSNSHHFSIPAQTSHPPSSSSVSQSYYNSNGVNAPLPHHRQDYTSTMYMSSVPPPSMISAPSLYQQQPSPQHQHYQQSYPQQQQHQQQPISSSYSSGPTPPPIPPLPYNMASTGYQQHQMISPQGQQQQQQQQQQQHISLQQYPTYQSQQPQQPMYSHQQSPPSGQQNYFNGSLMD